MGLFDKKFCDICGEKISLLGNRKLEDGNMCSDCAKLISPFFTGRKKTTVADMKEHLAYRERNRDRLGSFTASETYGDSKKIYIDRIRNTFVVSTYSPNNWEKENPDVIPLSEISGVTRNIEEDRNEIFTKDSQGNEVSYNPPRFEYEYDFYIEITLNSRWFSEIKIKLNTFDVEGFNSPKYHEFDMLSSRIVTALGGNAGAAQPSYFGGNVNNGSYVSQNPNMCGNGNYGGSYANNAGFTAAGGFNPAAQNSTYNPANPGFTQTPPFSGNAGAYAPQNNMNSAYARQASGGANICASCGAI
nr:DUF4428 domain-containing protein [Clostridiales bacterium]